MHVNCQSPVHREAGSSLCADRESQGISYSFHHLSTHVCPWKKPRGSRILCHLSQSVAETSVYFCHLFERQRDKCRDRECAAIHSALPNTHKSCICTGLKPEAQNCVQALPPTRAAGTQLPEVAAMPPEAGVTVKPGNNPRHLERKAGVLGHVLMTTTL